MLHFLDERGLRVASVDCPIRRPLYDERELENRIAAIKSAMQLAFQLKCGVLSVRIGPIPKQDAGLSYDVLREVLNTLARYGNRVGTILAVTPSGGDPEALLDVLQQVTEGPIGVNFDPAVYAMHGIDSLHALRTLHTFVSQFRVRDGVRDVEDQGVEVPVGRGEVEWDALLPMLDDTSFEGWMCVERTAGDDRIGDCGRAIEFLKRVMLR